MRPPTVVKQVEQKHKPTKVVKQDPKNYKDTINNDQLIRERTVGGKMRPKTVLD